ncbi:MAG: ABC transporter permease subunit [Planctomycetaceae bacterium]
MRPYLAVLKDSFREAFASRVLWLTLGLIALFLFSIAPLSLAPGLATELESDEIIDGYGLVEEMMEAADLNDPSVGKHLWSILSPSEQERIRETVTGADRSRPRRGRMRGELNSLLTNPQFYDAQAWQGVKLNDELSALAVRADFDAAEQAARNRRLLAAAFPKQIKLDRSEVMFLSYFSWKFDAPIPISPDQKIKLVNEMVVATCAVLLGFFGIFISILVTASLVPRTFEAGEISLLLSKPVSRPLLFLTRFLGGCAFTFVNAAFLMVGLWLLVGLRFEVWIPRLLLCIPIYLFLFMIYYAVSATTGTVWRNAILSICLTLVFWFALFLIATARESVEQLVIAPNRLSEIVPIGDDVLAVNESLEVLQWSEMTPTGGPGWSEVFRDSGGGPPRIARRFAYAGSQFRPTYDPIGDRILALEALPGRFGSRSSSRLLMGQRQDDWQRESAGQAPTPVHSLFVDSKGRVILVGLDHIYEFTGQSVQMSDAQKWIADKLSGFIKMGNDDAFRELRPKLDDWKLPFAVDMDATTGRLAVYSNGNLSVLASNEDGTYTVVAEQEAVGEDKSSAVVAISVQRVLVAVESGEVILFDSETLNEVNHFQPFNEESPNRAVASPDGRFLAVLGSNKHAWLYDTKQDRDLSSTIPGQGDLLALCFNSGNELIIADRTARVRVFDPETMQRRTEFAPPLDITELTYRYLINPVYTILPKPAELNRIVNYLLTENESVIDPNESAPRDVSQQKKHPDLWTPLWSNLAFLVVILGYACWHVSRRDY